MKCTVSRSYDGSDRETIEKEGSKEEIISGLMRDYEMDSRRFVTTHLVSPHLYGDNNGTRIVHYEVKWEDGKVDDLVLPYPSATVEPFSEDEREMIRLMSSVPLWLDPNTPLQICVNGSTKAESREETHEFITNRVSQLPHEVLLVLDKMDMNIHVRVEYPDGDSFMVVCGVMRQPQVQMPPDLSGVLQSLLTEVEGDDGGPQAEGRTA